MSQSITLKGITRAPSERAAEVGNCSESLNTYMSYGEIAPALTPQDLSTKYLNGDTFGGDVLYIHSIKGKTKNTILNDGGQIRYYMEGAESIEDIDGFYIGSAERTISTQSLENQESGGSGSDNESSGVGGGTSGGGSSSGSGNSGSDSGEDTTTIITITNPTDDTDDYSETELSGEEEILKVESVGNTLIIATNKHLHYVLFKDGKYNYLGTKFPFPIINFYADVHDTFECDVHKRSDESKSLDYIQYTYSSGGLFEHSGETAETKYLTINKRTDTSNYFCGKVYTTFDTNNVSLVEKDENKRPYTVYNQHDEAVMICNNKGTRSALKTFNSMYSSVSNVLKEDGSFLFPVMFKYGIKLYSGEVIDTAPVVVGLSMYPYSIRRDGDTCYLYIHAYKIHVQIDNSYVEELEKWSDVIDSINFYASTDIDCRSERDEERTEYVEKYIASSGTINDNSATVLYGAGRMYDIEKTIQSKSNFYNITRITIHESDDKTKYSKEYKKLKEGFFLDTRKVASNDGRISSENGDLDGGGTYMAMHTLRADNIATFNHRLIMSGIDMKLPNNVIPFVPCHRYYPVLKSETKSGTNLLVESSGDTQTMTVERNPSFARIHNITFFVRGYDGNIYKKKVKCYSPYDVETYNAMYGQDAPSFISYPDPRCFRADVKFVYPSSWDGDTTNNYKVKIVSLPMKEHPNLHCSYFLGGDINTSLMLTLYDRVNNNPSSVSTYGDTEHISNKIFQSGADAPFSFPVGGRYTVSNGNIIGMGVATMALSEGQFGAYPLYVFTDDGIWSMSTQSDGKFNGIVPMSRDVCSDASSITQLDNGIIFKTDAGVMLLQGSSVTNISDDMNGEHISLDNKALALISSKDTDNEYYKYLDDITDKKSFSEFILGAKFAYDYNGSRLFIFNNETVESGYKFTYAYIYCFDSQTWHKYSFSNDEIMYSNINGYPNCLVVTDNDGERKVRDFSLPKNLTPSYLTSIGVSPLTSIIETRAFDMGLPDKYKSIKRIRVRGHYNKGDVKYILEGSNNAHDWKLITSLRGLSFKMFRMVLLCKLEPFERITYIEVDFDDRSDEHIR